MQHTKINIFIKYYFRRTIAVDTRAIVSSYEPQRDLMQAAYRMTRWIDLNQPQELTPEESLSVNRDPCRLPPCYGTGEIEMLLPGHSDTVTRVPDHRLGDF